MRAGPRVYLKRNEEAKKNDFDYWRTSRNLSARENSHLTASLMMPSILKSCKFLDEA